MEDIINFQGNAIYHTTSLYNLSEKEKQYISSLKYSTKNDIHFISKNVKILDNPICNNLTNMLNFYAEHYIKNILEIDHNLKLLNSWVTINKKGSAHHRHTHNNTFISVCFYPQVKSGGISFYKPSQITSNTNLNPKILGSNPFNNSTYDLELLSRDIVIFPGWLEHYGRNNNSNLDRIMIGANYFISGNLGDSTSTNELELL